jgi:peptide/nickel transport system substrate-binding protein
MVNRKWMALVIVLILAVALLLPACAEPEEEPTTSAPTSQPTQTQQPTSQPTQTQEPTSQPTQTQEPTATEGPRYGGTYTTLTSGSLVNLGYSFTIPGHMTTPIYCCLEGFVRHNGRTGEYLPWLFTSWEEDPNEKYVIFHLREGVKYHDGSDFNAEGVKWYFDTHQQLTKGWLANVTSTEVIDEYTVKLNTDYFDLVMWAQLNEQHASPTQLKKGEEACLWNPVGTGPFKFVEYKRDQYLKYEAFEDYWDGRPYIDYYVQKYLPDQATQLAALLAGEGESMRAVQYKDLEMLKSKGFDLPSIFMVECGIIPVQDNPESPFADIRVRQAIEYAIDKQTIADALGYGYMEPFKTIYPEPMPGYVPGFTREYNPEKARTLLTVAGYTDGIETDLHVAQFAIMDVMVAVQQYLAEVGITVHIKEVDMGQWTVMRRQGWDGLLYQHGIFQAPYEYNLNRAYGPAYADYVSMIRPEGFNETLDKVMKTTDPQARLPYAEQLQRMVYDTCCYIPLETWAQIDAVSPKLHNHETYKIHGTQCWNCNKSWLSE